MSDFPFQYSEEKPLNLAPNNNQENQENLMIINSEVELNKQNKVYPGNTKLSSTTLPTSSSTDEKDNKKKKRIYANPLKNECKNNERKDRTICL